MARLLVVEDDKNQRALYEQELSEVYGFDVVAVASGQEAIAEVQKGCIDLVVLDIQMPGMNGVEALTKILSKKSQLPVILYTAYSKDQANFLTWSADAYLMKTSNLTPLVDKVKEILGGAQQPVLASPVPESAAVTSETRSY